MSKFIIFPSDSYDEMKKFFDGIALSNVLSRYEHTDNGDGTYTVMGYFADSAYTAPIYVYESSYSGRVMFEW